MYSLPLQEFIDEFNLEIVSGKEFVEEKTIITPEINRPAIQLAGFYEHFSGERPQLVGLIEHSFLSRLEGNFRRETLKKFFSFKEMPCFILSRSLEPFPEMLEYATESGIPVLVSKDKTTQLTGDILNENNRTRSPCGYLWRGRAYYGRKRHRKKRSRPGAC